MWKNVKFEMAQRENATWNIDGEKADWRNFHLGEIVLIDQVRSSKSLYTRAGRVT